MFATSSAYAGCKACKRLFDRCFLLCNNNMATNLQRFSYGRRRVTACDCWTQTSLAENTTIQWLLIVVCFVILYCAVWKEAWMKKKHCLANEARFLRLLLWQQERNEVRWRPGQEAGLAPPSSNLRSFGSKCTVLKKVFVTLSGLYGASRSDLAPHRDSAAGEFCSSCPPRYAHA